MSSSEPGGRRFLAWAAMLTLAAMVTLTAASAAIDPLGVLAATPAAPLRLCADGPKLNDERAYIPMLYAGRPAQEAIIGSSRAVRGFSTRVGAGVVNLGVSGASVTEMAALARGAADTGHLRRVWLVLDFPAFVAPSAAESLGVPRSPEPARSQAARLARGLASPSAWVGLPEVARHPERCRRPLRDSWGFLTETERAGYRAPSARQALALRNRLSRPDDERRQRYAAAMSELGALGSDLRGRGVEVVLVLVPFGPDYERQVTAAGLDPWRRRWITDLEALADRAGARLVDAGARTEEADFLDAIHFRSTVGDALLEGLPRFAREADEASER